MVWDWAFPVFDCWKGAVHTTVGFSFAPDTSKGSFSGSSLRTWSTMQDIWHMICSQAQCSLRLFEAGMPCSCHMGCSVSSSMIHGMKVRWKVESATSTHSVVVVLILHVARWLFVVTRKSRLFSNVVVIVCTALIMHVGSGVMRGPVKLVITQDLACGLRMMALKASHLLLIWKVKVCCHSNRQWRASGRFRRR